MTAACPAAAPGPRGPAAAGARRQRVKVPWRLVAGWHYTDAALAVYIKVAALAARPEGCTAGVEVLARYLGMSKAGLERALTELINPDPDGGVVEISTLRRTLPGGRGQTALRRVRPLDAGELYVWLPVAAAEALTPRLLRTYAVLAYATARHLPVADADLAWHLRHHTGTRAGLPLTDRTVGRLTGHLAALGWITLHRRAGHQGRHLYTVHPHPLTPVALDTGEGSGPDTGEGSLAIKEDRTTGRPENEQADGALRRRRTTRTAEPVDTAGSTPGNYSPVGFGAARRTNQPGPPLTLAPRIWHVLEPVRDLLPGISPYVLRRISREIGAQLDTYATTDRLQARLVARRAPLATAEIPDPGRWLLGAGLPRWGCGLIDCESGWLWTTGARCQVCAEPGADHHGAAGRPPVVWHECADCGAPSRTPLPDGRCRPCTTATDAEDLPA